MHNKSTNLVLKDLPPRAEELSPSEIQNVYGGCNKDGDKCSNDCDCCSASCVNTSCIESAPC